MGWVVPHFAKINNDSDGTILQICWLLNFKFRLVKKSKCAGNF